MKKISKSITELIGNTPLLLLTPEREAVAEVVAKLESFNPGGSVKDRVAISMIDTLESSGKLPAGGTLIEPTSGNTGIGLAMVAAARGYRLILTMPETMSIERRKLLAAYGAELHLTPGAEGMKGAIKRAYELNGEIENSVVLNQFGNESNPAAHYRTTAEEILRDTDGELDIFIACVGTGGTISGTAARLKELKGDIEVVAVEPAASPVLSGGAAGAHKIQGIGAGFIPENYNSEVVDKVMSVSNEDAFAAARKVAKSEGLLVGISSGAAIHIARTLAADPANRGKRVVVVLPDSGERYLSTELFEY